MSLKQAQRVVRTASANASADLDTYYYTDGAAAGCSDPGCEASILVGWTPPAAEVCGTPPLIGLIDTGIDLSHEALKGQSIEVIDISKETEGRSSLDHGTAIAALLVGQPGSVAPGLIPQARLVAVDAFSKRKETADNATVISLVTAIEALAERGVKVINLSLSGPPNEVLKKAVEAAQEKGIVLVAAVGNNGAGAEPSYPAAYPGVVAVTAVDRQLNAYRRATHGSYVEFAAPGVDVWTAQAKGGKAARSGTSYAVPFVSAAMAMLRAGNPNMDANGLQKRLQETTQDLGDPGRDMTFGYGLIQMAKLCPEPDTAPRPVAADVSATAAIPQEVVKEP
ncbi:S8 family serine peptidase [Microvirga solisilvae]|uniref:S8 family serine peptidase n=1 Tax=Microvirga solisilvae TaxID=2919498 RepID=UPI001FAFB00E|nr:S8 family serine peptidase [Microvirga solisilvae]